MRRLGGIFATLCMAALLWGLWLVWAPQPRPTPAPPSVTGRQPPEPGGPWPGLPDFRLPEFRLPDLRWPPVARPPRPPQGIPQAPIASPVERILIEKSARRMTVWQQQGPPRSFRIALGFSPQGDKTRQGDGRTPEGLFRIDRLNRNSAFHLSLGLDYPQPHHRAAARRGGYDPGGDIMIHGQPNQVPEGYRVKGDWTAGCIAVTNAEIEEIFAHARIGTPVEIRP